MLIWETKLVNSYVCPSSMKQCSDLGNWDKDKTISNNNNRSTKTECLLPIDKEKPDPPQAHNLICSISDIMCMYTRKWVEHFDFVHVEKY